MTIQFKPGAPDNINCKVYPQSQRDREYIKKWLEKELKLKHIAEEESNMVSPVYLIDKRLEDGTISEERCIIMDYQKVNEHTIKDHNALPNIQEAIEQLHGKRLFSKFDIWWGYNNI
jgi:hypothetical protein